MPVDAVPFYRHTGIIRKLKIGLDYKDAMTYEVGSIRKAGNEKYKITRISEDIHDSVVFGIQRHNVFGITEGEQEEKLRYSFHGMPCSVEYDNDIQVVT